MNVSPSNHPKHCNNHTTGQYDPLRTPQQPQGNSLANKRIVAFCMDKYN